MPRLKIEGAHEEFFQTPANLWIYWNQFDFEIQEMKVDYDPMTIFFPINLQYIFLNNIFLAKKAVFFFLCEDGKLNFGSPTVDGWIEMDGLKCGEFLVLSNSSEMIGFRLIFC